MKDEELSELKTKREEMRTSIRITNLHWKATAKRQEMLSLQRCRSFMPTNASKDRDRIVNWDMYGAICRTIVFIEGPLFVILRAREVTFGSCIAELQQSLTKEPAEEERLHL